MKTSKLNSISRALSAALVAIAGLSACTTTVVEEPMKFKPLKFEASGIDFVESQTSHFSADATLPAEGGSFSIIPDATVMERGFLMRCTSERYGVDVQPPQYRHPSDRLSESPAKEYVNISYNYGGEVCTELPEKLNGQPLVMDFTIAPNNTNKPREIQVDFRCIPEILTLVIVQEAAN